MKFTLNVLESRGRDADRHWPSYMFGGRLRTSTLVLIVAFFVVWWTYDTYRPPRPRRRRLRSCRRALFPTPNYTWVPRSRVQPRPSYDTPTPTTSLRRRRPTTTHPRRRRRLRCSSCLCCRRRSDRVRRPRLLPAPLRRRRPGPSLPGLPGLPG